jgi:hypothetical protein
MSESQPAATDPAVEAARGQLADWLTAQAPSPELGGYSSQHFLVSGQGVTSFSPSQQTLEDALAAARGAA